MDWLRNWKKRMFFSVAVGMAVTVIFRVRRKMSKILVLWRGGEPCILNSVLKIHIQRQTIMKIR